MRLLPALLALPLMAGTIAPVGPIDAFDLRDLAIRSTMAGEQSNTDISLVAWAGGNSGPSPQQQPQHRPHSSPSSTPHALAWLTPHSQAGAAPAESNHFLRLSDDKSHSMSDLSILQCVGGYCWPETTGGPTPILHDPLQGGHGRAARWNADTPPTIAASEPAAGELLVLTCLGAAWWFRRRDLIG